MPSAVRSFQNAQRVFNIAKPRSLGSRGSAGCSGRRQCLHAAASATDLNFPNHLALPQRPVGTSSMSTSSQSTGSDAGYDTLSQHLNTVFAPLEFPPELARRVLTHLSHKDAKRGGHNARMAFMALITKRDGLFLVGRRVLETYLMLFLHSCPPSQSVSEIPDYATVAARALNTYILGEHVALHWNLGSVVRWNPARDSPGTSPSDLRSIGLFKVYGTTVEAIMGGVLHQFGGSTAHRVFHTRLLPHILLPGRPEGLLDTYHARAHEVLEQMGGLHGPLAPPS